MNKVQKTLSLVLALFLILSGTATFAADFELFNKVDSSKNYPFDTFLASDPAFNYVGNNIDEYVIEYGGKYYEAKAINDYLTANPDDSLTDAINSGIPAVEKPAPGENHDLEVIGISAVKENQIQINFSEAIQSEAAAPENFKVVVGGAEKSFTVVDQKETSVTLQVDGLTYNNEGSVEVKGIKNLSGDKTVSQTTKTFKVPGLGELFKLVILVDGQEDKELPELVGADGNAVMLKVQLQDQAGNVVNLENASVKFLVTKGTVSQGEVVLQNGELTNQYNIPTVDEKIEVFITATISNVLGKTEYEGLTVQKKVSVVPKGQASETKFRILGADAEFADRIYLTLSAPLKKGAKLPAEAFLVDDKNVVKHVEYEEGSTKITLILDCDNAYNDLGSTPVIKKDIGGTALTQAVLQDGATHNVKTVAMGDVLSDSTGVDFILTEKFPPTAFSTKFDPNNNIITVTFSEAIAEDHAEAFEKKDIAGVSAVLYTERFLIDGKPLFDASTMTNAQIESVKAAGYVPVDDVYVSTDHVGKEGYKLYKDKDGNVEKVEDTRNIVSIKLNRRHGLSGKHSLQVNKVGDWGALTDIDNNTIQTQTLKLDISGEAQMPEPKLIFQSPEQWLVRFSGNIDSAAGKAVEEVFDIHDAGGPFVYGTDYVVTALNNPTKIEGEGNEAIQNNDYFMTGTKLNAGDPVSGRDFLIEFLKDWTKTLDNSTTNINHYTPSENPYVLTISNLENLVGNPVPVKEIEVSEMRDVDGKSPEIAYAHQVGNDGTLEVVMDEPVQMNTSFGSLTRPQLTPSQKQEASDGVPVPTYEFINEDHSKTVYGKVTTISEDDYIFQVQPDEKLEDGKWTIYIRSISDDIGNTSATVQYPVVIETVDAPVPEADAPYVEWIGFDNSRETGSTPTANGPDGKIYDRIYVKFSQPMYFGPDANSAGRTENYAFMGQVLPRETQITQGIEGVTANADGVTITMPHNTWRGLNGGEDDYTSAFKLKNNLKSVDGKTLKPFSNGKYEVTLKDTDNTSVKDHDLLFEAFYAGPDYHEDAFTTDLTAEDTDTVDGKIDKFKTGKTIPTGYSIIVWNWDDENEKRIWTEFAASGNDFEASDVTNMPICTDPAELDMELVYNFDKNTEKYESKIMRTGKLIDNAAPVVWHAEVSDAKDQLIVYMSEKIHEDKISVPGTDITISSSGITFASDAAFDEIIGNKVYFTINENGNKIMDGDTVSSTVSNNIVDFAKSSGASADLESKAANGPILNATIDTKVKLAGHTKTDGGSGLEAEKAVYKFPITSGATSNNDLTVTVDSGSPISVSLTSAAHGSPDKVAEAIIAAVGDADKKVTVAGSVYEMSYEGDASSGKLVLTAEEAKEQTSPVSTSNFAIGVGSTGVILGALEDYDGQDFVEGRESNKIQIGLDGVTAVAADGRVSIVINPTDNDKTSLRIITNVEEGETENDVAYKLYQAIKAETAYLDNWDLTVEYNEGDDFFTIYSIYEIDVNPDLKVEPAINENLSW